MNICAETMTFEALLQEIQRQGVRLRVTPEGRLQAAGLTPALRPALRHHRARLKAHLRGWRGVRLEARSVRWVFPPITNDWLAWAEGASTEHVPPGLERIDPRQEMRASFERHQRVETTKGSGHVVRVKEGKVHVELDDAGIGETEAFDPEDLL